MWIKCARIVLLLLQLTMIALCVYVICSGELIGALISIPVLVIHAWMLRSNVKWLCYKDPEEEE